MAGRVGINIGFDKNQFDKLADDLRDKIGELKKVAKDNPIDVKIKVSDIEKINKSFSKLVAILNKIDTTKVTSNTVKAVRDMERLGSATKDTANILKKLSVNDVINSKLQLETMNKIVKQYKGLGEIKVEPISKDALGQMSAFNLELKKTDGTIEKFKYKAQGTLRGISLFKLQGSNEFGNDIGKISEIFDDLKSGSSFKNKKLDVKKYKDFENYIKRIKRDVNELKQIEFSTGEDGLDRVWIEYTNNAGRSIKETLRVKEALQDVNGELKKVYTLETERLKLKSQPYKTDEVLSKTRKELESLKKTYSELGNVDISKLEVQFKKINDQIQIHDNYRKNNDEGMTSNEKKTLEGYIAKLKNDVEIAKNNNKSIEDTNKQRQSEVDKEASEIRKNNLDKYYNDQKRAYEYANQYQEKIYGLTSDIVKLDKDDTDTLDTKNKQLQKAVEEYTLIRNLIDDSFIDHNKEIKLLERENELKDKLLSTESAISDKYRKAQILANEEQKKADETAEIKTQSKLYDDLENILRRIYNIENEINAIDKNDINTLQRKQKLLNEEYEDYIRIRGAINKGVIDREREEKIQKNLVNLNEKLLSAEKERQNIKQKEIEKQKNNEYNLGEKRNVYSSVNSSNDELNSFVKNNFGKNAEVIDYGNPKISQTGNLIRELTYRIKDADGMWRKYKLTIDETAQATYKLNKPMSDLLNRQISIAQAMKTAITRMAEWAVSGVLIYGTIDKIREGIGIVNEINKSQTNVMMIRGMSREEVQGLTKDYSQLAGQLHETTSEIMKGAEEFLRAGHDINATRKLLQASTIASKISGQDQKETSDQLIAITNGFKVNIEEVMGVIDKLSAVDNASATSLKC